MKYLWIIIAVLASTAPDAFAQKKENYRKVEARKNADDSEWVKYIAKTVDRVPGFRQKAEASLNEYGSWKINRSNGTGYFRTEKINGRWWIIDPDGYPFISKGVAVFSMGGSDQQQAALARKYGSAEAWAAKESEMLRSNGFNSTGAWSNVAEIKKTDKPLVYTVIINPMGDYKREHIRRFGGKYLLAGWQGYRFDLAMVFDPEFTHYVEEAIKSIVQYKDDKYLLGYFTDNELPWVNDALDRHLNLLAKDEPGYLAAKLWLEERKGKDLLAKEITDEDRLAFSAFYFETYMQKVTSAIKKYDANHMYLGCRFNQEKQQELTNPEIFRVAGKYMDIISINHYRKWEPDQTQMKNWITLSGKPFLITEWYTKGEDSGLPNKTGTGWNVKTQAGRGYFYENFTIELIKSKGCVGWHWFKYQDNDPQNLKTDPSNRDSNKGIVDSNYNPYEPLLRSAKILNSNVYNLINYFDEQKPSLSQ